MNNNRRATILRVLALVFVIGLMVLLFLFRDQVRHLEKYGYLGIFLISIVANATVLIPLPGVFFTSTMGAIFNPFWVAIAAGSGSALGELSGYLLGFSGQTVVARTMWHERIESWMGKYGDITILLLAFIPNPLFDMAGMTAGALKMPIYRFLFWTLIGKTLKMMMFAYGGATISGWFAP
jgi:membrane protein YqaA with SNARE-associated domain